MVQAPNHPTTVGLPVVVCRLIETGQVFVIHRPGQAPTYSRTPQAGALPMGRPVPEAEANDTATPAPSHLPRARPARLADDGHGDDDDDAVPLVATAAAPGASGPSQATPAEFTAKAMVGNVLSVLLHGRPGDRSFAPIDFTAAV